MKQINNRASAIGQAGYSTNVSSISNNNNNNDNNELVLAPGKQEFDVFGKYIGDLTRIEFTYTLDPNDSSKPNMYAYDLDRFDINYTFPDETYDKIKYIELSDALELENSARFKINYKRSSYRKDSYILADFNETKRLANFLDNYLTKPNNNNGRVTKRISSEDGGSQGMYTSISYFIMISKNSNKLLDPLNSSYIPPSFVRYPISSQNMHHIYSLDESDKCFRVTSSPDTSDTAISPFQKYNVEMLRDYIELRHDVSISGSWGGTIIVTISKNWNIIVRFVTADGWRQNNQWIYGRLWFKSGDDIMKSNAAIPGESVYTSDVLYPNNNYRNKQADLLIPPRTTIEVEAFRRRDDGRSDGDVYNVNVAVAGGELQSSTKQFRDYTRILGLFTVDNWYLHERTNTYDIPTIDSSAFDSIYILRYQALLEGYYGGTRRDDMRIHISGDIRMKLPGNSGSSYNVMNYGLGYTGAGPI
jgi:hypothetical protein